MPDRRFPTHLRLSPALERFLAERGIRSLDDVRRTGGLARLEGLPVPVDDPAIRILEAHTDLDRLAAGDALVGRLIENGYDSVVAVAEAPRGEFVARVAPMVGDAAALRMHADATAQTDYLTNVLAARRADRGTRYAVGGQDDGAALAAEATARCHCDDCETAISPGAYLAELVDYALRRLRRNGARLTLDDLSGLLYQPLGALPMSCDSSTTQVRQVRLAVEVLRRYLLAHPAPAGGGLVVVGQVEPLARAYRVAAYTTLLVRIGTSYEEVRLARLASPEDRQRLADRLGIDLRLVLLPWGRPGVQFLSNTLDALALDPGASSLQPLAVTEPKLEQLFGLVDTTRDPLAAGRPSYLETWRLEHLRTQWREEDRPADPYAESLTATAGRQPVIDPDLIGPDDFREPVEKAAAADPDGAFDVWLVRRQGIDALLDRYQQDREANGLGSVLRLALGTPLPDLDALGAGLGQSADPARTAEAARAIDEDLLLSLDAFQRLMAIRAKDRRAALDARSEVVTDAEWEEVYAILVQSRKEALRAAWLAEESAAGIRLGPAKFWASLREPAEGEWPPRAEAQTPLIDPDLLKPSDLVEPGVGKAAADLLTARITELKAIRASLRAAREAAPATGFDRAIELALGQPTQGDPLPYDLDDLAADLEGAPAVAATARARITDDLRLSEASFERLLAIRAKDSQTDPAGKPTVAEYEEVYDILTPARKLIHEYPTWAADEQAAGVVYWNALKARLPRWRASADARLAWTHALGLRSASPIIDPDVVGLADLETPALPDAAYAVWQERTDWLATEWAALAGAWMGADPLTGLDTVVQFVLGLAPVDLQALDGSRRSGADLTGRLAQLGLTPPAFTRLVGIRWLLAAGQPILDDEWAAALAILLQALKRRRFGEWREREAADGDSPRARFLQAAGGRPHGLPAAARLDAGRVARDLRGPAPLHGPVDRPPRPAAGRPRRTPGRGERRGGERAAGAPGRAHRSIGRAGQRHRGASEVARRPPPDRPPGGRLPADHPGRPGHRERAGGDLVGAHGSAARHVSRVHSRRTRLRARVAVDRVVRRVSGGRLRVPLPRVPSPAGAPDTPVGRVPGPRQSAPRRPTPHPLRGAGRGPRLRRVFPGRVQSPRGCDLRRRRAGAGRPVRDRCRATPRRVPVRHRRGDGRALLVSLRCRRSERLRARVLGARARTDRRPEPRRRSAVPGRAGRAIPLRLRAGAGEGEAEADGREVRPGAIPLGRRRRRARSAQDHRRRPVGVHGHRRAAAGRGGAPARRRPARRPGPRVVSGRVPDHEPRGHRLGRRRLADARHAAQLPERRAAGPGGHGHGGGVLPRARQCPDR